MPGLTYKHKQLQTYNFNLWVRSIAHSIFMFLFPAAKAQLLGESAVYVKQGSTISLVCAINLYSEPPPDITWFHGAKVGF